MQQAVSALSLIALVEGKMTELDQLHGCLDQLHALKRGGVSVGVSERNLKDAISFQYPLAAAGGKEYTPICGVKAKFVVPFQEKICPTSPTQWKQKLTRACKESAIQEAVADAYNGMLRTLSVGLLQTAHSHFHGAFVKALTNEQVQDILFQDRLDPGVAEAFKQALTREQSTAWTLAQQGAEEKKKTPSGGSTPGGGLAGGSAKNEGETPHPLLQPSRKWGGPLTVKKITAGKRPENWHNMEQHAKLQLERFAAAYRGAPCVLGKRFAKNSRYW